MERVTFLKNYKDDEKNRSSLNSLLQLNRGVSLETWYAQGYWQEQYIPYSFTDGTQIIANVSVYKQDVLYKGQLKSAIRLEHIILHPQYHYKHLIERLIYQISEEYKDKVDLIYLSADEAVIPFYPRFGFKHIEEVKHYIQTEGIQEGIAPEIISKDEIAATIMGCMTSYRILGDEIQSKNDFARRCFDYMTKEEGNLYYFEQNDTYIIARLNEDELEMIDIIKEQDVALDEIVAGFKALYKFNKVKLNNKIEYKGIGKIVEEIGDNLLFVKETNIEEENLFPIIIEA